MRLERRSPTSLFLRAQTAWTTTSSLAVPPLPTKSSSTRGQSSKPSTKLRSVPPPGSNGTAEPGDRPWRVELHPAVAKTIAAHGGAGADVFRPSIGELIDALETDPKQFPKKKGKLETARAAPVTYADGIVWRAVYTVDERRDRCDSSQWPGTTKRTKTRNAGSDPASRVNA
jgi:hypothetical protein